MIKNSAQQWHVGSVVRIGFLSLVVRAVIATPGDGLPDVYFLSNIAGTKLYEFVPHHGLQAITTEEAAEKVSYFRAAVEGIAASEVANALKAIQIRRRYNEIFAVAV